MTDQVGLSGVSHGCIDMYTHGVYLPLPEELLEAIDKLRGDVPRTVWIRRAIEARITKESK